MQALTSPIHLVKVHDMEIGAYVPLEEARLGRLWLAMCGGGVVCYTILFCRANTGICSVFNHTNFIHRERGAWIFFANERRFEKPSTERNDRHSQPRFGRRVGKHDRQVTRRYVLHPNDKHKAHPALSVKHCNGWANIYPTRSTVGPFHARSCHVEDHRQAH